MLRIDFSQNFLDHRSVLVLVKKLGRVKEDEFSQLFENISQLRTMELPNGRTVHLRYTRHISHQFVDWGSFHTHKKLLGILSVARVSPDKNLMSVKEAHESLKTWYSNTSLDSRCFLLGYKTNEDEQKDKELREFVFLNEENLMESIERHVADYALSLFLVLDAKRMERSLEKPDKISLLRSPLDGDLAVDGENRNRKLCLGRMKKYIGDLCLLTGLAQEAVFHYCVAIDLLRSIGDTLWLCGCFEGLCAASLLCRGEKKTTSLERSSLQLNVNQLSSGGSVNGVGGDLEETRVGTVIPLTDEEIIEKAEDIFQVYDKHKDSKVLAVEARFKYARFFIKKKRYKDACHVLQEVLSTEFALSDTEKIQQYSAMSIMYEDIGFMRKAAFFTRMAALRCTSQHLPLQGWTASYNLLRNALDGYKIHFDSDKQDTPQGWPQLQITLIKELIKMSEELQTPEIPIRHISYLLHAMYEHMEETVVSDLTASLESLAGQGRKYSLVDNLVLGNGDILPPVSWTHLPVVSGLKVNALASHLRPFVSPASPVKTPFIFSTLSKKPGKKHSPIVNWVEGDVGEVAMHVFNPMPFDIKVSKMTLLTEGLEFEAFPSCLALSNDRMSHPFMLLGIPKNPGQLRIKGYSVEVFGIQSNCVITKNIIDNPYDLPLVVNVTPRLPLLQFQSSIPNIKSSVNSSHKGSSLCLEVLIYTGQRISGPIIVENVSTVPVENFTITLLSSFKPEHTKMIELIQDEMRSLPLPASSSSQFSLVFNGSFDPSSEESCKWSGKIKVLYSGGLAWQDGMSRQAAIDIRMEIVSSLKCSHILIAPLESDDQHFELSMDIHNPTNYEIEWSYEVNEATKSPNDTTSVLPAKGTTRSCLVLEKFDLSKIEDKRSESDRCIDKLSKLVKLHWRIPAIEVSGIFHLGAVLISEETLNILRKHCLTFELQLNGLNVAKEETLTIQPSWPVMVTVKATNCSNREVKPSILNIEPYEYGEDGTQVFEVKPKVCWLGSTSTILPKIDVGSSVQHTCGFLFLSPGQYYINVKCFEKTASEHAFRGRSHVIKSSTSPTGQVRPRSSRSESFTDTLLVRQRSFSIPMAMLANSAIINVVEDSEESLSSDVDLADAEGIKRTSCNLTFDNLKADSSRGEIPVDNNPELVNLEEIVDSEICAIDSGENSTQTIKDVVSDGLLPNDSKSKQACSSGDGRQYSTDVERNKTMLDKDVICEGQTSREVRKDIVDQKKKELRTDIGEETVTNSNDILSEANNVIMKGKNEIHSNESTNESDNCQIAQQANEANYAPISGEVNEQFNQQANDSVKQITELTKNQIERQVNEAINSEQPNEVDTSSISGPFNDPANEPIREEIYKNRNEEISGKFKSSDSQTSIQTCEPVSSGNEAIKDTTNERVDELQLGNSVCGEPNNEFNEPIKEISETNEAVILQSQSSLTLQGSAEDTQSCSTEDNEDTCEVVRSPSVKDRVMFFSMN